MNEENQAVTDDVWTQLDNEIAGLPSTQEGQQGETHGESESEEQGGADSGRDTTQQGTETTGATDIDTEGGPDDGAGRESRTEREDNAEVDYTLEVEIPMPYGMEKMTVGELKDQVSEIHLRQERLDKQSNEVMTERDQLNHVVEAIEPYLTPEVMEKVTARRQAVLARENQRMLEAIPEWSEATVFQADRKNMQTLAGEYGFSEREFQTVSDHRLVKLLRDFTNMRARIHKAQNEAKPMRKGKTTKPGHKTAKPRANADTLVKNASASTDQKVKDAAIQTLIEGT
jgi:hypothetical protein